MKLLLVSLFIVAVAVHASPEDATPYKTITGHRGAGLPVRSAHMIPLGYHVQPSYALDYQQPTIHYNYGPAIRAEETFASPRAPLVMQPEVAFVPDHLNNKLASAEDVPVYSNTPVPTPSRTYWQSFLETEAEAEAEAELEADAEVSALLETDLDADADADADADIDAEFEADADADAEVDTEADAEAAARAQAEAEDLANEQAYQSELSAEAETETEAEAGSSAGAQAPGEVPAISLAETSLSAAATVTAYTQARRQAMEAEEKARDTERRIALLMHAAEIHKVESARQAQEDQITALIRAERARDHLGSFIEHSKDKVKGKQADKPSGNSTVVSSAPTNSTAGFNSYVGPKRLQKSAPTPDLNQVRKAERLQAKEKF